MHSHTFPIKMFYSFTKSFFFLHLQIFCHNAASWQRTEALVSQRQLSAHYSFNKMKVRKKTTTLLSHPIGNRRMAQIKPDWEDLDRYGKHERCMKRELEDPEMSVDRLHSDLYNIHEALSFTNTKWKQSKCVGEKGLLGIDIKYHPLCWQPCMHWQHQSLFLLNQCFHAMFKIR